MATSLSKEKAKGCFGGDRMDHRFSKTRYLKMRNRGESFKAYCIRISR